MRCGLALTLGSKPELELVLVIRSADPLDTIGRVVGLASVGRYGLLPKEGRKIHDVYFDTEDGLLRRRRTNLRIREVAGEYWITLKQSAGRFSWRRDEREEFELPWSRDLLKKISRELEKRGVRLKEVNTGDSPMPGDVLRTGGLTVLQDRHTQREVRDIVDRKDGMGAVLAELAVDSVTYHFESGDVHLYELEIEAKSSRGRGIVREVRDALLELFEVELIPWKWGKLATGRMVERLLQAGALEGLLEMGRLRSEAYAKLERALTTGFKTSSG